MFSVILLAALTAGDDATGFHFKGGCYGGCSGYAACYGGCYGGYRHGCYGCGGCTGAAYYGYGSCYGTCYGGCYGAGYKGWAGCWGASYSCYGGTCYGGCAATVPSYSTCGGGCYGGCGVSVAPGYACAGGCGGYLSAAYGHAPLAIGTPVAGTVVAVAPIGGVPEMGAPTIVKTEEVLGSRARVTFALKEGDKLFVDGTEIKNAAEQKTFRTPELKAGEKYFYELKVEGADGKSATKKVFVKAGDSITEDFTTVERKGATTVAAR